MSEKRTLGIDVGGQRNPSAICVVTGNDQIDWQSPRRERTDDFARAMIRIPPGALVSEVREAEHWVAEEAMSYADANTRLAWRVAARTGTPGPKDPPRLFTIEYVEQRPVPESLPELVRRILQVGTDWSLDEYPALAVEINGVGQGVYDMLKEGTQLPAGRVVPIRTTGGEGCEKLEPGRPYWGLSASFRVGKLYAAWDAGRISYGERLTSGGIELLERELGEIHSQRSPAGRETFVVKPTGPEADDGDEVLEAHGDVAVAIGLAVWWASRRGMQPAQLTYPSLRG